MPRRTSHQNGTGGRRGSRWRAGRLWPPIVVALALCSVATDLMRAVAFEFSCITLASVPISWMASAAGSSSDAFFWVASRKKGVGPHHLLEREDRLLASDEEG